MAKHMCFVMCFGSDSVHIFKNIGCVKCLLGEVEEEDFQDPKDPSTKPSHASSRQSLLDTPLLSLSCFLEDAEVLLWKFLG